MSNKNTRNARTAQENLLHTRASAAMRTEHSTLLCRKCGKVQETSAHVTNGCNYWVNNLYIERHDQVARNIYFVLCDKYNLLIIHYTQQVPGVQSNAQVQLYWNTTIQARDVMC